MKKVMVTLSAFALVAVMAACGSSPESKAKDIAKKSCDCIKSENPEKCMDDLEKENKDYVDGLKGEDSATFAKVLQQEVMPCVLEAMGSAMSDIEL